MLGMNSERMAKFNRGLFLFNLFRLKQATITELANLMDLSIVATSRIAKELEQEHKVCFSENLHIGRGRKAGVIHFVNADALVICIDVRPDALYSIATDLFGQIKCSLRTAFLNLGSKEDLLNALAQHIKEYMKDKAFKGKKFRVALAFHGQVDSKHGISLIMPQANWHEPVYVKYYLEKELNVPVLLDNDCVMRALAQKWFLLRQYPSSEQISDFCVINLDYGIGSSFLINQEVYRGDLFGSGQIGHTIVDPNGRICSCGRHGCLETVASLQAIERQVNFSLQAIRRQSVSQDELLHLEQIVKLYKANDEVVRSQVNRSAMSIGRAIYNFLNVLNINHIYLYGNTCLFGEDFLEVIREEVWRNPFDNKAEIKTFATAIEFGTLSLEEQIAGIGYVYGEQLFNLEHI